VRVTVGSKHAIVGTPLNMSASEKIPSLAANLNILTLLFLGDQMQSRQESC
jgi:hypothetical protein